MKNTAHTKSYLLSLITIFTLIVVMVEIFKKMAFNKVTPEVFEHSSNSTYLLILPIISISILFFMAMPRNKLYKLGYYATTLGLILINTLS